MSGSHRERSPPALPSATPARRWRLEEATARLPALRELLAELRGWLARREAIATELERLSLLWGKELLSPDSPDRALHERLVAESRELTERLDRAVLALHEEAIELRDLDAGLLDFYADRDGETILLCWREGEEEIAFYHSLSGGFAGRRPLRPTGAAAAKGIGPAGARP